MRTLRIEPSFLLLILLITTCVPSGYTQTLTSAQHDEIVERVLGKLGTKSFPGIEYVLYLRYEPEYAADYQVVITKFRDKSELSVSLRQVRGAENINTQAVRLSSSLGQNPERIAAAIQVDETRCSLDSTLGAKLMKELRFPAHPEIDTSYYVSGFEYTLLLDSANDRISYYKFAWPPKSDSRNPITVRWMNKVHSIVASQCRSLK